MPSSLAARFIWLGALGNSALMDALIRERESQLTIGMKPRIVIILLVFVALTVGSLALAGSSPALSTSEYFIVSQDVTRPTIWAWGIDGEAELQEPFSVWANVTDNEGGSGIQNVTLVVNGPNATIREAMTYNSTSELYEENVPALPNDGVFRVALHAFDMENNSRSSYDVDITVTVDEPRPVDQSVTLPAVVGGSLAVAAIVFFVAYSYDKRRLVSE
jgi:hypothetical protein